MLILYKVIIGTDGYTITDKNEEVKDYYVDYAEEIERGSREAYFIEADTYGTGMLKSPLDRCVRHICLGAFTVSHTAETVGKCLLVV